MFLRLWGKAEGSVWWLKDSRCQLVSAGACQHAGECQDNYIYPFQDQIYRWKAHVTRVFVGSMIHHLHLRLRQHLLLVARRPSPVTEKPRQCVQQAHLIQSKTHTV